MYTEGFQVVIPMKTKPQYNIEELRKLVIKVCHSTQLSLHHNMRGSKKYNQHQLVALLVLKARSGLSLRRFVSWLHETKWPEWLNLPDIPSHMSIHRAMARLNMKLLRLINNMICSFGAAVKILTIDATGIDSHHRSRHYERRIGAEHTPYVKLDALLNPNDFLVHDFTIRTYPRHDVVGAKTMLRRIKHQKITIIGDKGYDCEELCEISSLQKNRFYAPVRNKTSGRIKGRHRRQNSEGCDLYGQRSLSETGFSILKRCYVSALKSRKHFMKKKRIGFDYNCIQS
jgi:hypothetical protein